MTSHHTPGPWAISGISMDTGSISVGSTAFRIVICDVTNAASLGDFVNAAMRGRRDFGAPDTAKTQWANARLIAAAPELIEALKGVLPEGWLDGTMDHMPGIAKARVAIEKAEGAQ